jgi:hypothetical protein
MTKSKLFLSVALLFFTAFTAAAAKNDSLPNLDIQKLCRSRARAVVDLNVGVNTFEACVNSEQEARAALVAAWKDIPAFYKASCIKPNDYSPSYAEWIACLELYIDVKHVRSNK